MPPARPSILLVVLDSVRAASLGSYGCERETTPHLDTLAREGVLYERAVSAGCWTLPVHATLFTGLYPTSHGLTISKDALADGFPTLATQLRELGYRTGSFSANPYISAATGLTQGFEAVDDLWRLVRPRGTAKPRGHELGTRLRRGGPLARTTLRALRAAARSRSAVRRWRDWQTQTDAGAAVANEHLLSWIAGDSRPFFAFVNLMESHEPYRPPHPWNSRFLPSARDRLRVASLPGKTEILRANGRGRAAALEVLHALYDGTVAYLDHTIGELVAGLDSLGCLDDTVVVMLSDHGESLGEHDHIGHRLFLYEQLVHVPLIIRHPPTFPAGERRGQLVELGDLFPTLLELAGASPPSTAASAPAGFRSLLGAGPRSLRYAIAENTAPKSLDGVRMRMVRDDRYKLIRKSSGQPELYDLVADPGETRNLTGTRPEIESNLDSGLAEWERALTDNRAETREATYDDETMRRLKGLGYVG